MKTQNVIDLAAVAEESKPAAKSIKKSVSFRDVTCKSNNEAIPSHMKPTALPSRKKAPEISKEATPNQPALSKKL